MPDEYHTRIVSFNCFELVSHKMDV